MNILIPMAGAGSRFAEQGYVEPKPFLPLTSRHTHQTIPMVVGAVHDLPVDLEREDVKLFFLVQSSHLAGGVDKILSKHFPRAQFITIDYMTAGQASTCLHARELCANEEPLIIAACDNGMDISHAIFAAHSSSADALIFTFRGNDTVLQKPASYGWVHTDNERVTGVSIKQPISDMPMNDHAIVGAFWFKTGHKFFAAVDQMIANNDRINGEFYVDQVFKYLICAGLDVRALEVDRYLCWGTPEDYETYEATLAYWSVFVEREPWVD